MDGATQTGVGYGVTPSRALAFVRGLGARGFHLDSKALLRLHRLLFLLIERGEWPDDPGQLRSLMAPAICTSADQQAEFYLLFDELAKYPEGADLNGHEPGLANEQSKTADAGQAKTGQSTRTPVWRKWLVIGLIGLALVGLALISIVEARKPATTSPPAPLSPPAVINQPPPAVNGPVSIQAKAVDQQSGKELVGTLVRYLGNTAHDTGTPTDLVLRAPQDDSFWVLATRGGYQPALKLREQGAFDPFTVEMKADPPSGASPPSGTPPLTAVPLTGWRGWAWGHRFWLEALSAAAPALALAGWWLTLYYRRSKLRKFLLPLNLSTYKLRAKNAAGRLLRSQTMKNSAREFRLRRPRLSSELDQTATVNSSIRNGTWFTPVPARARLEPEYLVLIERFGPRDQQARFYDELVKRLESRDVTVDRYFFAGDPRECTQGDKRFSISELAALHPHHDLWIVTDSDKFLNRVTGEPADWVAHLSVWTARAVLTSTTHNPYADWLLRHQDFRLVTADPAGLALLPGTMAPTRESSFVPGWDAFPRMLRGDSARWVSEVEPSPADKSELFTQVRRFLGAAGYDCLSACAIYPAMSWNLTVELVASVAEGDPPEPILARLVRLPWFRRGKMPEWARTRLTQRLPEVAERRAYPAIERFIDNSVTLRWKTDDWLEFGRLTAHDQALLFFQGGVRTKGIEQDYVFLSFLWRQKVGPIAPEPPSWLRRKLFKGGYVMFGAQPLAHGLLAAVVLLMGAGGWWAASAATSRWKPVAISRPASAYPVGFRGATLDIARAMAGNSTGVPDTDFVTWCELKAAEILARNAKFKAIVQPFNATGILPGDQVDERDEKSMDWSPALVSGVGASNLQVLRQRNGSVGWKDDPHYFDRGASSDIFNASSFRRSLDPPSTSPVSPKDYLPAVVDWSSQMSRVRTGAANEATGIAMAEIEEFLIRKELHETVLLNPSYISSGVSIGTAATPGDLARALVDRGAVTQSTWRSSGVPPSIIEAAPHYRVQRYRTLSDLDAIRMALAAGPVAVSFDISTFVAAGSNLANPPAISGARIPSAVRKPGLRPVAGAGFQVSGAYPVAVVGYDDQKKRIKFMGIGGPGWGDHGYGYLAYGDITGVKGFALSGVTLSPTGLSAPLPVPPDTGHSGGQIPAGQCIGPEIRTLDNMNVDAVRNSGTPPGFQTADAKGTRPLYCLVSITTYHWNDGKGSAPGKIGLTDSRGNYVVGPVQAVGSSGQGGAPNVNWTATFSSPLILLRGSYLVRDSAPATWSQNSGSGGRGFARVVARLFCVEGQDKSCGGQGASGGTGGAAASGGGAASSNDPASELRALGWLIGQTTDGKWSAFYRADLTDGAVPSPQSYELLRSISGLASVNIELTKATQPSEISALGGLTQISSLTLASTTVTDISALRGLTNLTSLEMALPQVGDITPLKSLIQLKELGLDTTGVKDVPALANLRNLTTLDLAATRVTDLSPLKGLGNLTRLMLASTNVTDLSPLKNLIKLSDLNLETTGVKDLSALANLTNLTTLWLTGTGVTDLSPLRGLGKLTELHLSNTRVRDVSPLKGLLRLQSLDLDSTAVTDVSPLATLKSLTLLSLFGTKVSNTAALKTQLPNLRINGP